MVKIDLDKKYTVEEYLALEAQSELRHEFFYGNLYEMPGNTIFHERMVKSLIKILEMIIHTLGFEVFSKDIKVKTPEGDVFFYPDLVLVPTIDQQGDSYVAKNPLLIIEVLSDSTRRYDSTDKFIQYSKIDSLHYYLLVEPEKQVVFFYEKADDGDWIAKTYTKDDEEIKLPLLNANIRIGDIYAK
jgi:Uma2 family endonuclease